MSEQHQGGPAGDAPIWALGLMSGTSMDGVDAALLLSDGHTVAATGPALTLPYPDDLRARLRAAVSAAAAAEVDAGEIAAVERLITEHHAAAVAGLLAEAGPEHAGAEPAVIGFHGHTLWHRPAEGRTRQIGDGALLARLTGRPVVDDFRSADMAAGGQGAPLAPLYHAARLRGADIPYPVCILNIGGVANVTWIGGNGVKSATGVDDILAFDTGPGSALIDDWVAARTGQPYDADGALAAAAKADRGVLRRLLDDPYFKVKPPKSLDRAAFDVSPLSALGTAAGAATLTAFSAEAVARALDFLPAKPAAWLATGGGRHNPTLMGAIGDAVGMSVKPVEAIGWNGDSVEAEAFAFLAVRSLRQLPLSVPNTTGVARPITGGRLHCPAGTEAR
ncbi:MAG: anhydro-N-acetylmuramic acid kinase [Alphaproteobacteria bacterium]|nr:anhydro-N-acetylmuramic acid kinase [Alphaproteobacteria bacterium]